MADTVVLRELAAADTRKAAENSESTRSDFAEVDFGAEAGIGTVDTAAGQLLERSL